jgi:hypothetical protein
MFETFDGVADDDGKIRLLEPVQLLPGRHVLVTFIEPVRVSEAILSERSFVADWLRSEEDAAWANLRPAP